MDHQTSLNASAAQKTSPLNPTVLLENTLLKVHQECLGAPWFSQKTKPVKFRGFISVKIKDGDDEKTAWDRMHTSMIKEASQSCL